MASVVPSAELEQIKALLEMHSCCSKFVWCLHLWQWWEGWPVWMLNEFGTGVSIAFLNIYIYIMCIVGSYIYIYLSIIMYIFPLMNSQTFPIKSLKRKCLKVLWWAILIGKARVNKSTYYLKKNRCFRLFLNSGSSKKEWFVNMVFGAAIIDWFLVGAKQWHCMRVWCGEQLIYSEISNDL